MPHSLPKILTVDDRVENLVALERLLSGLAVEIVRAESGNEALKALLTEPPDSFALVLMDVHMPKMDGFETVALMRRDARYRDIPVIFLSAVHRDEYYQVRGIRTGGIDFLTKPIVPEILIGKVTLFLELFHGRMAMRAESERRKAWEGALEDRVGRGTSALEESESRYRRMMEALGDPVYICRCDHRIAYLNPAMAERIGTDAPTGACHAVLHGFEGLCSWCDLDCVLGGTSIEIDIMSPLDGRAYRAKSMPIQYGDQGILKMTILRDMTDYLNAMEEKKRADARLWQMRKMESMGTLAGGIAHDFNNILASIIGNTELAMGEAEADGPMGEYLREIFAGARRARDLVRQILTFSRQTDETPGPLPLGPLVKETLKLLRASVPSTIDIRHHVLSDAKVLSPLSYLDQVLLNLCTNAAQAMEETGGVLEVGLTDVERDDGGDAVQARPGKAVKLTVSDTGRGIPPEIRERIFEPYFSTKKAVGGTGLGLAVVHGIVSKLGGRVMVESREHRGTVFTVYLPAAEAPDAPAPCREETVPTGNERILLIDDEPPVARMSRQMLERLGYRVTVATDSREALEVFRVRPGDFDLVKTDMTMPHLTGDRLAVEVMKIRPDIPVILCTGFSKKISEASVRKMGIKALVYKPLVMADLARVVRSVLDEARAAAQSKGTGRIEGLK